jgi:hypothetical protein
MDTKTIASYRRRPETVMAVQHHGDVQETFETLRSGKMMEFAGYVGHGSGRIEVETMNGSFMIGEGEWLVFAVGGPVSMSDEVFRREYEQEGVGA